MLQPGYASYNGEIFGIIKASDPDKKLIAAAPDMLAELMNYCAECCGDVLGVVMRHNPISKE